MKYKTELHCHTSEISPCSTETAEQVAEKYIENGYTTLVVTNHAAHDVFYHKLGSDKTWDEQVECYYEAVDKVRRAANGKLNVIAGMEVRFEDEGIDFLVYGLTPEMMKSMPDMFTDGRHRFRELTKEKGVLFIKAHPMRFGERLISPDEVDGYEIFNGHTGQRSHNDVAEAWAKHFHKHNLILTSGTDNHYAHMIPDGGIITDAPITTSNELSAVLRSGKYEIIRSPLGDAEY